MGTAPLNTDFTLAPTLTTQPQPNLSFAEQPKPEESDVVWENLSSFRRISRAFTRGRKTIERGQLGEAARQAGGITQENRDQIENLNNQINALGGNGPGFVGWVSSAAEFAGTTVEALVTPAKKVGDRFTNPDPNLSAIQNATQSIDAIGEAIVLPIGMWKTFFAAEGGNTYLDLLQDKVDPQVANVAAVGVGAINASLEMLGLGGATKPLATATKRLLQTTVKEAVKNPRVMQWITRAALSWGKSTGSEVATETMQELTSIAGEEWAKRQEGIEGQTQEEILARVEDVMIQTFKGAALLGVPGAATEFVATRREALRSENQKQAAKQLKEIIDAAPDPAVAREQATAELERNEVRTVWISADAVVEAAQASDDAGAYYAALGVGDQIQEAAILGGDVKITAAKYIDLLSSDEYQALADHVRYDRDGLTLAEAKEAETLADQIGDLEDDVITVEEDTAETPEDTSTVSFKEIVPPEQPGPFMKFPGTNYPTIDQREKLFEFNAEGKTGIVIVEATPDSDTAFIRWIGAPSGTDKIDLGPTAVRGIVKAFQKVFPHVRKIEGLRVSGARSGRRKYADVTTVTLPSPEDEQLFGMQAFFKNAKDAGMTDKEYETYLQAHARQLEARIKKQEIIKLRKELRNNTEEMKARRVELEEVAREIVDNQPVYASQNGIQRERLNRQRLVELVGEENVRKLPKVNGRTLYEENGTIDPEVYAEAYGFEGTDIMVWAWQDHPPKAQAIKDMTEQLFNERYVGLTENEQRIEADIEALHTDESAGILALELNKLREAIGQKRLKPRLLKLAARERIRDYKLKEINPKKFVRAEQKAAQAARKALRKGNRTEAAQHKFRELMNHHMATESYKIIERTKNQYRYFQKFRKRPKKGAALPIDFFMAIRTMLGEIDFKKPSLTDFQKEVFQSEGVTLEIPFRMRVDNGKTYYLDKTLKEWESLYYTVKNTEKQGLDLNKMMREQDKATRDEKVAAVVANVQANLRQLDPDTETYWQQFKNTSKNLLALVSNTNTIVRRADGFKDFGPVYDAIKRPYDHAISRGYQPGQIGYVAREVKEAKRIRALQSMYTKKEQLGMAKSVTIPGVRRRMSHQKIIMVLLNNGNMGNRQALLDSGWTEAELDAVINAASEKDTQFAQAVWDYLDEFWPEIVDSTKRRRNLIPEKIEARPVETKFGTLRGGYFPIMYKNRGATFLSNTGVTDIQKLTEALRFGNFISSMTRHGHTLEREGNPGQELNLDLFDLHRHVQHVIYDIEVGDATIDIAKILNHREVKRAFAEQGQQHLWDQLELWFANIVMGEMHTGEAVERAARYLRSGFVVARIGYNVGTILQQPLGLLQSAPLIGKFNTLYGVTTLMTSPLDSLRTVRAMSPMMQQRQATYNVDVKFVRGQLDRGLGRRLSPKESLEFIRDMSFYGLIKLQSLVDHATWIGAKRKGMALFNGDAAKSSEYADMMVIRTQGSGIFGERTPLERGTYSKRHQQSDVIKAMFPLMSYFFTKLNVANERIRATNYRNPLSIVDLGVDLGCLFVFEALLSALIVGDWPDDEEDTAAWAAWTAAKSVMAGMPVVNWITSEVEGFHGGGSITGVTADLGRLGVQISQGEIDAAAVKAAARVVGDVTRLPGTAEMIRIGEGVVRAADGEDVNAMEYLLGPRWRE